MTGSAVGGVERLALRLRCRRRYKECESRQRRRKNQKPDGTAHCDFPEQADAEWI